jgi:hypothetical protein
MTESCLPGITKRDRELFNNLPDAERRKLDAQCISIMQARWAAEERSNYEERYARDPATGKYGYYDRPCATLAQRKGVIDQMAQMPLRDPDWKNNSQNKDGQGRLLHYPDEPYLTIDGGQGQCYLPAINFLVGAPVVPPAVKRLLVNATIADINLAIKGAGLICTRIPCNNGFHEILSRKAGAFLVGGKVNNHRHWVGLNCFKGAMAMGNGTVRFLEASDVATRKAAKKFFTETGFQHVSEVYALRAAKAATNNKKKRKRK